MNLAGIHPRNTYSIDVLSSEIRHSDVANGSRTARILRELGAILQRNGYVTCGNLREGFEAYKGEELVKIIVEKL